MAGNRASSKLDIVELSLDVKKASSPSSPKMPTAVIIWEVPNVELKYVSTSFQFSRDVFPALYRVSARLTWSRVDIR